MRLSREEQETHIYYSACDGEITIYTEITEDIRYWKQQANREEVISVTPVGDYGLEVKLQRGAMRHRLRGKRKVSESQLANLNSRRVVSSRN